MKSSDKKLIALLSVLALAAAVIAAVFWFSRPRVTVLVTVDGEEYGRYALSRERVVVIEPEDGSWHNTLIIENDTARIAESDCSNQVCVFTPALNENYPGLIVCLPHGVVVELRD